MKETNIMNTIACDFSMNHQGRLFRNNTGQAWQGKVIARRGKTITLAESRQINFGLCKGSSDLIGWREITITSDMVGKKFAQFTGIEVKTPNGKISKPQQAFCNVINSNGGYGLIISDPDFFKKTLI